jgi:hypothetical protein
MMTTFHCECSPVTPTSQGSERNEKTTFHCWPRSRSIFETLPEREGREVMAISKTDDLSRAEENEVDGS